MSEQKAVCTDEHYQLALTLETENKNKNVSLMPALGRLKQEDCCKFQDSLGYRVGFRLGIQRSYFKINRQLDRKAR